MMEGYLSKWTNYVSRWKKRYFVLLNGILHYSKKKGNPYKGSIHLDIAEIEVNKKNPKKFSLNSGIVKINLKAKTKHDADLWINALRQAKSSFTLGEKSSHERMKSLEIWDNSPKFKAILNCIQRLWVLDATMEEKFSLLEEMSPEVINPIQALLNAAKEFKNLSSDTLALLEEESEECKKQREIAEEKWHKSTNQLTLSIEKSGKENDEEEEEEEEEEKVGSNSSDEEFFEDAQSQYTPSLLVPYIESSVTPIRQCLPFRKDPSIKINVWKVIKDFIGVDLSKMSVPVYFNEPLSFLQKFSEDLTYSEILTKAASCEDSALRLAYVSCFAVSSYSTTQNRIAKPFNPILGETFEYEKDGFKLVSEQVSHHPPVSAIHVEHPSYTFNGQTQIKSNFKGTYMRVKPLGAMHVRIHRYSDYYIWNKVTTDANNIIVGKIYLDHHGTMNIKNQTTGDYSTIKFEKKGWFNKKAHEVDGKIYDAEGKLRYTISGQWSEKLTIRNEATGEEIIGFEIYPYPAEYEHYYYFTQFSMQLNIEPDRYPGLCPTDCRFRPDQRALESGDIETATVEKARVEDKQRAARIKQKDSGIEYTPRWFYMADGEWKYRGGYWEERQQGKFTNVPDIF